MSPAVRENNSLPAGDGASPQVPAPRTAGLSALPWRVHNYVATVGPYNKGIDIGPPGVTVAVVIGEFENPTPGPEAEAIAAFIVLAANSHHAMKEALEVAREHVRFFCEESDDEGTEQCKRDLAQIDAALALVSTERK